MSARTHVTLAAAAYRPEPPGAVGQWADKLGACVAEAAAKGAELLVLPEYAPMELSHTRGPDIAADLEASLAAVSELMPEADRIHADLAQRHGVHILAGSGPRKAGDGRYRNVARLFAPNGRAGAQEKLILTPWERDWRLAAGERPRLFDTTLGRVGVAICYDAEFPLLVRAQVEAGAEIILVPACTDAMTGYSRVRIAALARALEGQCVTVLAPLVGDAPWCPAIDRNIGAAGIYAPADRGISDSGVLAEGRLGEPGWTIARVDLAAIRSSRLAGEVRTVTHWIEQPGGAMPLGQEVEHVDLRG
jgi:predicted amidohydrolase